MEDRKVRDRQIAYYGARAGEYDEWFLRQGRYDRGPEQKEHWMREAEEGKDDEHSSTSSGNWCGGRSGREGRRFSSIACRSQRRALWIRAAE